MSKEGVCNSLPHCEFHMPSFLRRAPPLPSIEETMSLWSIDAMLRIRVLWATYVNVRDVDKVNKISYFLFNLLIFTIDGEKMHHFLKYIYFFFYQNKHSIEQHFFLKIIF